MLTWKLFVYTIVIFLFISLYFDSYLMIWGVIRDVNNKNSFSQLIFNF